MGTPNKTRRYQSNKRKAQAESTREAIIEAGRKLFLESGYANTTVASIAREAGVAVPTVYASIGGKQGILLRLVALIDELGDEDLIEKSKIETDQQQIIRLVVRYHRQTLERGGDIIKFILNSAPLDQDVADALEGAQRTNRELAGKLVEIIEEQGSLHPSLDEKEAGDVIATLLNPTIFDTLRSFGWSFDACEAWLSQMLISTLLPMPNETPPRRS